MLGFGLISACGKTQDDAPPDSAAGVSGMAEAGSAGQGGAGDAGEGGLVPGVIDLGEAGSLRFNATTATLPLAPSAEQFSPIALSAGSDGAGYEKALLSRPLGMFDGPGQHVGTTLDFAGPFTEFPDYVDRSSDGIVSVIGRRGDEWHIALVDANGQVRRVAS